MAGVAVLFLGAYAVEVLVQPHGAGAGATRMVTAVSWAMFLLDYVVRLGLARNRWRWFYSVRCGWSPSSP